MKKIFIAITLILCIQPFYGRQGIRTLKEINSFGGLQSDLFFFITDIDTDENENIYITDSIDCCIKKIDGKGNLICKAGRKGQGPGEFQYPVLIKVFKNNVYVVDQSRPGISVFSKDLKYKNMIIYPYPIYDLQILSNDEIILNSIISKKIPPIVKINMKGDILNGEKKIDGVTNEWWKSAGKLAVDKKDDIYFISSFENSLIKCDYKLNIIWKSNLGEEKRANLKTAETSLGKVVLPTEMLYKDIKVDDDRNIYLLCGKKNKNNSRELLILNSSGDKTGICVIPHPSHLFHIDNKKHIYALADEGVTIKKYLLN
jgi:hypothetical protein